MNQSIVFYSDILGFKNLLKQNKFSENFLDKIKKTIESCIALIDQWKSTAHKFEQLQMPQIEYKLFSDNLYVSCSFKLDNPDFKKVSLLFISLCARQYQYAMIANKILIRGAISFGLDYHDDKIIYSEALIKSYEIEQNFSIYPRIVLDKELVQLYIEATTSLNNDFFKDSLIKDWSDLFFLNPFSSALLHWFPESGISIKDWKENVPRDLIRFLNIEETNATVNNLSQKDLEKIKWARCLSNWFLDRTQNKLGFESIV